MNSEDLYKIIQKANEEQTIKLSIANEKQTKLLQEEIRTSLRNINEKIDNINKEIENLKNKVTNLEKKTRKNNIVVFGLQVQENLQSTVLPKLNNILGTNYLETDVNNIYKIGKNSNSPVIIEFISFITKQTVFPHIKKLKGSGITIKNDLSIEEREERKLLIYHLNKARTQNIEARIKGNKLVIGNNIYSATELKDLDKPSENEEMNREIENYSGDMGREEEDSPGVHKKIPKKTKYTAKKNISSSTTEIVTRQKKAL